MKHSRYPKGLSVKRKWTSKFGLLSLTVSGSAPFKSRVSCNSSFYFFLKGLSICLTHFMNSKCKNLTISSLQANIGSENKSPPEMTFDIDFHMAPKQFDFFIP